MLARIVLAIAVELPILSSISRENMSSRKVCAALAAVAISRFASAVKLLQRRIAVVWASDATSQAMRMSSMSSLRCAWSSASRLRHRCHACLWESGTGGGHRLLDDGAAVAVAAVGAEEISASTSARKRSL